MKTKKKIKFFILLLIISLFGINVSYSQDVPLVFDVENRGADCTRPNVAFSPNTNLPDPFEWSNGTGRVSTCEEWSCRRNEIKAEIEHYEIGRKPEPPTNVTATYTGGTLRVTVTEGGRTLTLSSNFTLPSGAGPHPVVIGMNSGTGSLGTNLFTGVVQVPFNHDQVVNYNMNGQRNQNDPFYQLYPNLWGAIANYSAWSWGVSRIIDGLFILQDELNINVEKIAVTGCSYAGKMALFAGAFDERIALTIAQESGGGGITSWRVSETLGDVEKIDNTNYSWFLQSMQSLNPNNLPHDHHELIGMIAPRAFLALGNEGWTWMADESGYVSLRAAHEIWKAMGVGDRFGFDMSGGHQHCQAATSQNTAVTRYVDRFLRASSTANTEIYTHPYSSLNYARWWTWTTPTITCAAPVGPRVTITSPSASDVVLAGDDITISANVTDPNSNITLVEFFVDNEKIGEDNSVPYSYTWTPTSAGEYVISVIATNALSEIGTAQLGVEVRVPQSPYGGTPHPIPGKVEFEYFDEGGNGLAYYDDSQGSSVTPVVNFRTDEDVDIEECEDTGGGYNLGWTTAGEWLEYTVNVQASGTYDMDLRVACNGTGRSLSVSMDGTTIANNVAIPDTEGWQEWQTVTVPDIELTAGTQIMRVTIGNTDYINMNYVTFIAHNVIEDLCPDDPNKTEPGECGCGVPEGTCGNDPRVIQLNEGWNIIGCPLLGETAIESALSSIWDKVIIVKDMQDYYIFENPPMLNSLTVLKRGRGYLVKVSEACELEW